MVVVVVMMMMMIASLLRFSCNNYLLVLIWHCQTGTYCVPVTYCPLVMSPVRNFAYSTCFRKKKKASLAGEGKEVSTKHKH